jgi:hypothetical protein
MAFYAGLKFTLNLSRVLSMENREINSLSCLVIEGLDEALDTKSYGYT